MGPNICLVPEQIRLSRMIARQGPNSIVERRFPGLGLGFWIPFHNQIGIRDPENFWNFPEFD